MAYQTGNATSVENLLAKLATFAQTVDGWVVDKIGTKTLYIHNDNCFWSFIIGKSDNLSTLYIAVNDGFNSNQGWGNQPNSSIENGKKWLWSSYIGTATNFHKEPFVSYTFLATSQYIHVVVRVDSRRFRHFGIGTLNREGNYKGGHYAYGTHSKNTVNSGMSALPFTSWIDNNVGMIEANKFTSVIRVAKQDYFFGNYYSNTSTPKNRAVGLGDATFNYSRKYHPDMLLVEASLSTFNNLITLVPNSIYTRLTTGQYQRVGVVPDFYVARIDSVIPGTIQEINGEKFYCCAATTFQTHTKEITNEDNSYNLGYFYRVIE